MLRKITFLARGAKCPAFGRSGSSIDAGADAFAKSEMIPLPSIEPVTREEMAARRETVRGDGFILIEEEKFVAG